MSSQTTRAELAVPQPRGARTEAFVLSAIVLVFTGFAIWRLASTDRRALPYGYVHLVASSLWLLLVGYYVWRNCRNGGFHKNLTQHLGQFSRKHFVERYQLESGAAAIRLGFRLFGRRFFYEQVVQVADIVIVEWSCGQSTCKAGRDMHDWQVHVCYDLHTPAMAQSQETAGPEKPSRWSCLIGCGCKETIRAFGVEFLGFLGQAGTDFVRGRDDHTYIRIRDGELPKHLPIWYSRGTTKC
jgi:hypothetical protein